MTRIIGCLTVLLLLTGIAGCSGSSSNVRQDVYLADQGYQELVKGNYEKAEANLKVALSINPENPYALLNLGVLYQNTGKVSKAKEMYRKLLALDPEDKAVATTQKGYKGKKLTEIARANLKMLEEY